MRFLYSFLLILAYFPLPAREIVESAKGGKCEPKAVNVLSVSLDLSGRSDGCSETLRGQKPLTVADQACYYCNNRACPTHTIIRCKMENLDRQCEKFMGGPTISFSERVYVTISRGGAIFLNRKAHKMMGAPSAVYLYYNRPKDMIILESTSALTANNAFLLREAGSNNSGRTVYARPFCMHFGIRPDTVQKFLDPQVDSAGRMYVSEAFRNCQRRTWASNIEDEEEVGIGSFQVTGHFEF